MMQYKARCWYFGGNLVLDIALRIDVSEPHLFLSHNHSGTARFWSQQELNKYLEQKQKSAASGLRCARPECIDYNMM